MDSQSNNHQPRVALKSLAPYVGPDKSELGGDEVFLASNENSQSNAAVSNSINQLIQQGLHRYPPIDGVNLRHALAKHYGLDQTNFVIGNGSSEILSLVARSYLDQGDSAIFSQYCFAVYPLVVMASGAESIEVPALHYGHDLQAMAQAIQPNSKVIFIADPNNPTGTSLTLSAMAKFMALIPESVLVVWDRAYREYLVDSDESDDIALFQKHKNLVITRTFSKIYSLASMRIGYGIAHAHVTDYLNRVRMPFNANSLALHAAIVALSDQAFVQQTKKQNIENSAILHDFFTQMVAQKKVTEFIPSTANFICFATALHSNELVHQLKLQNIVIRGLASYQMPNFARVSIGTATENAKFMRALEKILDNA